MTTRRVRVTIEAVPLVIQPTESDTVGFAQPQRGEWVTALPSTPEDRREGRRSFEVVVGGWLFAAATEPAGRAELRERATSDAADHRTAAAVTLRAQIPGRVLRVWVTEGESVESGQRLLAIEAMKMENEIRAPHRGVVTGIRVEVGDRVDRHADLLSIS